LIEQVFVPAVIAVSTALGVAVATRRFGWPARTLLSAWGKALECVGAAVVFCVLNAAVGAALILAGRALSGRFVSLYLGADHTLLAASALQAVLFQWWRESSRRG
jgi:hypothetical protein